MSVSLPVPQFRLFLPFPFSLLRCMFMIIQTTTSEIQAQIEKANQAFAQNPQDASAALLKVVGEYQYSWGVRGDNTPENAKHLGYLLTKDLYRDSDAIELTGFEDFLKELLEGKGKGVYEESRKATSS